MEDFLQKHRAYVICDPINNRQYLSYNEDGMMWYFVPYLISAMFFKTKKEAENEIETLKDTDINTESLEIYELKVNMPEDNENISIYLNNKK